MERVINQFDVFWVTLDPTIGSEIAKTRPCVVVSPTKLNKHMNTVVVVPLTSATTSYRFRTTCCINGHDGEVAIDQIRTVDQSRVKKRMSTFSTIEVHRLRQKIHAMFCEPSQI